jgi:LemA protein
MKKALIIIGIIVVIIAVYFWTSYNGLVTLREDATAQWQQVETQYQRRFDLIPNLVNSVKGVLTQEQSIFTALAEARTRYTGAQTVSEKALAAGQVETAFGRLLAVIENYPTLKSSENVRDLMTQLEGTENRISTERMRFNEIVRTYSVAIQRFPKAIVASMFGFDKIEYFEAAEGTEVAPTVDLQ